LPEPLSCAVVPVKSVAPLVLTDGAAAGVANDSTKPNVVP
jgi:hypothetical protein